MMCIIKKRRSYKHQLFHENENNVEEISGIDSTRVT